MKLELQLGVLRLVGEARGTHIHVTALGAGEVGQRPLLGRLTMTVGEWSSLQATVDVLHAADRRHQADRAEVNRLTFQLDDARASTSRWAKLAGRHAGERDQARAELDALQPIRSVLGDWDWPAMVADDCVDDGALERAAKALAAVAEQQAKAKGNR